MKQIYTLVFALVCFGTHAQVINFPDANFKAAALDPFTSIDTDGDGEITQQEAADAFQLNIVGAAIHDLEGLQYFTHLSNLYVWNTSVTSFTLPPSNYNELRIDSNPLLTSVTFGATGTLNRFSLMHNAMLQQLSMPNVTGFVNECIITNNDALASVGMPSATYSSGNEFTITDNPALASLTFPLLQNLNADFTIRNNPALLSLDLGHKTFNSDARVENNGLTSVGLVQISLMGSLFSLADNHLASVNLSQITADGGLSLTIDVSGNNFTDINLAGPWSQMSSIYTIERPALVLNHTQLTSLDFDPQLYLSRLTVKDNAQLQTMSFRNNDFETCSAGYCAIGLFEISNNTGLQLVCTDPFEVYALSSQNYISGPDWVHQTIDPNVTVSTNCFYTPAGNYNTAIGTVRYDADANGCSATDVPLSAIRINNNGYQTTSFSNAQGSYSAFTTNPQITLTPSLNTTYFTVSPPSQTLTFPGMGNTQTADFCLAANGVHNDLAVDVIPLDVARPGLNTHYSIVYRNQGTSTQSGTVSGSFWNDQQFVSASVPPSSQTAGNVVWNFSNLLPFESRTIEVTLHVNSPTDTPAVNSGNTVYLQASVSGATDETPSDNGDSAIKTVVNSFDPNDKQVSQGAVTLLGQTYTDGLTYTVRFQNTGTAEAQRVIVTDVLDSEFDANTVQAVASSHPFELRRIGNTLEFWFENINLPYESANEAASHGFVTFSVKSAQSYDMGSLYENTANIYFDYNLPIVTNTAQTSVVQLGTAQPSTAKFSMYPNPAKNVVNVKSGNASEVKAEIFSLSGQSLLKSQSGQYISIDISKLATGTYLVKISSADGSQQTQKLIKF